MLRRAYARIEVKAIDEEQRIIEGIASTPSTDRMEDVVEPLGAEFALPIPFLWQHESREAAIGEVFFAKPTKDGIPFKATIASDDVPGLLKDRLDYAWRSIKKKLVRAVSIGFRELEMEPIKGTFGLRFKRWEWLELSAVTIPANAEATIQTIKSYDLRSAAAPGTPTRTLPGASGPVKLLTPKTREGTMTNAERIAAFEAKRAANMARLQEITDKASEEGRSKDAAEQEEFDTLDAEVETIDKELVDIRKLDARNVADAKAIAAKDSKAASAARDVVRSVVQVPEKLEPGIEFARFAMCLGASKGNVPQALALAQHHYPGQLRAVNVLKAAASQGMSMEHFTQQLATKDVVVAGTTTDATWALPLLEYNTFVGDFLDYLRPRTILGQFGQNGVPSLRQIPFNVHVKGQTTGGTGYWVGQGKPKPVTKFDFSDTYHGFNKVAAIAVLTEELIRFSNPSAERLVREALSGALIERMDTTFIDPAEAVDAGVSPASITNGVAATTSSGDTADDVRTDIQALWAAAIAANLPLTEAVYITTPSIALGLSLMMNPLGNAEFPGMTMRGGNLLGVPVIVSNHVPAGLFVLAFASELWLSDDGAVTIDASREASIQMLDNPTNDSGVGTATAMVSMFQTNSVALRAERFITWSKRRATAVAVLDSVGWGGAVGS